MTDGTDPVLVRAAEMILTERNDFQREVAELMAVIKAAADAEGRTPREIIDELDARD